MCVRAFGPVECEERYHFVIMNYCIVTVSYVTCRVKE